MSSTYPLFWWPNAPTYAFDRAEAERLLDQAGYPRGPDGKRFELDCWAFPSQTIPKAAEVIRDQLARVGITVKVVNVDVAAWTNQVYMTRNWQMHIVTFLYGMDPVIGMHRLLDSRVVGVAFQNNFPEKNPQIDKLLDAVTTEINQTKRNDMYRQIQVLFNNDLPFVTLTDYAVVNCNIWSAKFTDVVSYPVRSHENLENVKLA
jgi:peptide/nickel transport system substrate-binding protein